MTGGKQQGNQGLGRTDLMILGCGARQSGNRNNSGCIRLVDDGSLDDVSLDNAACGRHPTRTLKGSDSTIQDGGGVERASVRMMRSEGAQHWKQEKKMT